MLLTFDTSFDGCRLRRSFYCNYHHFLIHSLRSLQYNHHLAAVNSVTFVDGGRKMVTTSDDKKMLIWEWDIGVPIKYIAEPDMHSMPAVTAHPQAGFMVCQR